MGCAASKAHHTKMTASELHRAANKCAIENNLARGNTRLGHGEDLSLLQFAGDGSLIIPVAQRSTNSGGFLTGGLGVAACGGGGCGC